MYSLGVGWQQINIGSGNGLAPNRCQAITWTNDDPVDGHIYKAPYSIVDLSSLAQFMLTACCLSEAESLQEPMLTYCQMDLYKQT